MDGVGEDSADFNTAVAPDEPVTVEPVEDADLFTRLARRYKLKQPIYNIEDLVLAVKKDRVSEEVEDVAKRILKIDLFDYPSFASEFLRIIDTKGREVPLKFNKPQQVLEAACRKDIEERGLVRLIICKARRKGTVNSTPKIPPIKAIDTVLI